MLSSTTVPSPLGSILLIATRDALLGAQFIEPNEQDAALRQFTLVSGLTIVGESSPILSQARRQLEAYFHGKRRGFSVPIRPRGTPFQRRVWSALRKVPFGTTAAYGTIATRIGQPKAARAVAQACGRNPISVIVPCHRIIAADGKVGGFSAGLHRKQRLLTLEGQSGTPLPLFAVAKMQESEMAEQLSEQAAVLSLSEGARDELQTWAAGQRGRIRDAEALLYLLLESLEPQALAPLLSYISRLAVLTEEPCMQDVGEALLGLWLSRLLESKPSPDGVNLALSAAVRLNSPAFERLGRRLNSAAQDDEGLRKTLAQYYQALMEKRLSCSPRQREISVDLWLELRSQLGTEAWAAETAAEPSVVLQRAGRLWEATLSAERRLAEGQAPQAELLDRLVKLYIELEEYETAAQRLLARIAEERRPADVELLRWLQDRLRG